MMLKTKLTILLIKIGSIKMDNGHSFKFCLKEFRQLIIFHCGIDCSEERLLEMADKFVMYDCTPYMTNIDVEFDQLVNYLFSKMKKELMT